MKIYAQLACIMPFDNIEWEKLHWFLKFLIPKLKIKDKDKIRWMNCSTSRPFDLRPGTGQAEAEHRPGRQRPISIRKTRMSVGHMAVMTRKTRLMHSGIQLTMVCRMGCDPRRTAG